MSLRQLNPEFPPEPSFREREHIDDAEWASRMARHGGLNSASTIYDMNNNRDNANSDQIELESREEQKEESKSEVEGAGH